MIPLEILGLNHLKEEDKRERVKLLLLTGDIGREYKELICESCGTQPVHSCFVLIQVRMTSDLWPLGLLAALSHSLPSTC